MGDLAQAHASQVVVVVARGDNIVQWLFSSIERHDHASEALSGESFSRRALMKDTWLRTRCYLRRWSMYGICEFVAGLNVEWTPIVRLASSIDMPPRTMNVIVHC